jgi:hypothetical protein
MATPSASEEDGMTRIIRCKLPDSEYTWRPAQFPGSDEARSFGCTCPEEQPWPGAFDFAEDCPLHELEQEPSA